VCAVALAACEAGLMLDVCVDHDERIPLFTRAVETDPELPYAPLLRYDFRLGTRAMILIMT
jgi:hypothetical protein